MSILEELKSRGLGEGNEEEETELDAVCDGEEEDKSETLGSLLELLSQMRPSDDDDDDDDDGDDDDDDDGMDADDYHNKAVGYARRDQHRRATEICMEGLKRYPKNVDLLADTVKYSSNCGDLAVAEIHYRKLRKLPFCCWNWRAFTFSFDYLLASDPVGHEDELRFLVARYKEVLPYEERAYVSESELEEALGNHDRSMEALAESIQCHSNACQSALKLADKQFERGMYADVVNTCNYGLAASVDPQPSINIPYLLLLRTMAKDHLLLRKATQEPVTAAEVNRIDGEYQLLLQEFPHQMLRYDDAIRARRTVLKFISLAD
jgi:tetratricopeptide (TPR) repeat protein